MFFLNSIEYLQDKQENDGWSNIKSLVEFEAQQKESDNVKVNFIGNEDENKPIEIKKNTYSPSCRVAQQKYRDKYPDKYCALQRKLYQNKKTDEEWKKKYNERSKVNNAKYREKKMKEFIESGGVVKPKGRPKKVVKDAVIEEWENHLNRFSLDASGVVEQKGGPKKVVKDVVIEEWENHLNRFSLDASGVVEQKGRPKKVKEIVVDVEQPIKQFILDDSSNDDVKPVVEEKPKRKYVKKEKKV
jgi:hypothetical protein